MTKEELLKLKQKISQLSEEEIKKRDLYLRALSNGDIQGQLTGYPSIDKPWLKFYTEENILKDFDKMSIYQLMHSMNIGHEKEIAINYFGRRISYGELEKNIDIVSKALLNLGVKSGDIVMMSLPNIPEAEYLFYALNKIGAIVNSIDPRTSEENILKDIEESKLKYFFAIDVICPKLSKVSNDVTVIPVSPYESLPFGLKQIASLKNKKIKKQDKNIINWNDFIQSGKKSDLNVVAKYEENSTAVIVHTGGSTGTPKGVMLTNENFNGLIYQLMYNQMNFRRGSKFLNILPPFIALGLDNAMHLAACLGIESIMIPTFEPEDIPKLILKHKPNLLLCGPIHCVVTMNSKLMKNQDLSFLELVCSGGDKMPKETEEKFQEFLKDHNAPANIWLGYGATETSAGSACLTDKCFRFESVGAPYLKNVMGIFNPDNGEEICGYNKIGELRVNAPTLMKGYFGTRSNETEKVIHTDDNGKKWYLTGDLAHFDQDGALYIDGRIKRIITRRGFKIYPLYVEELILQHPAVRQCAVVGVEDQEEINIPVANIVLNDEFIGDEEIEKDVINFVNNIIEQNLPEYSMMAGFNFLNEMPMTPIGKLDFKKLEKIGIIGNSEKQMQKRFKMN